ncbi:hypothetical protein ACMD2_07963 [Ananas comosus]|uniref:Late embryogenesis abundant protein LEA-2 subgroup domain-containing protein n=1 Tax=Ananas comosus TaxID=4615 RepID=A0A199V374_ANACO|nr:hypothetical protein ACMD2_07963 [Ananas comosus]
MDSASKDYCHRHRHRCRGGATLLLRRCALLTVAALLALALVLVVLALTVFRHRHAVTTVDYVRLAGLRIALDVPDLGVDLNLTLDLAITAYNPNRVGFRYGEGNAELYYRGALVGAASIPAGEVAPRGKVRTDVELTLLAGRLAGTRRSTRTWSRGRCPSPRRRRSPGGSPCSGCSSTTW